MSNLNVNTVDVMNRLRKDDASWSRTPDYKTFDRAAILAKTEQVYYSIIQEGYGDRSEINEALKKTNDFIERSFDMYESKGSLDVPIERAFAVPMRTMRNDESYASEVLPFVPLLDPKFGVNSDVRQRTLVGFPPSILDTYTSSDEASRRGALILTPLFGDMESDLVTAQRGSRKLWQRYKLGRLANRNINLTAQFARQQLGVDVMGLGAIIPSITKFGTTIKEEGLITTTGHAGTVHLIVETARKVIEQKGSEINSRIGIIGAAGSIGFSTLDAVTEFLPDFEIATFDKNRERLSSLIENYEASDIKIKNDVLDVITSSDIILTAITGKIDFDLLDPYSDLDLTGKYIIDDSQPGCFDKEQVEKRGGKLLWVVGEDESDDGFLTRDDGYNYGDEAGIWGKNAVWGCEAEAGVIAASGYYDMALRQRVEPRHVRSIGKLCTEYNVSIAPFQAYGQPVNLD